MRHPNNPAKCSQYCRGRVPLAGLTALSARHECRVSKKRRKLLQPDHDARFRATLDYGPIASSECGWYEHLMA
jgi:hypothetical protein